MIASPNEHSAAIERRHLLRTGSFRRFTTPQLRFLASPLTLLTFWGANGIGKSVALAEYTRRAIEGTLEHQVTSGPVSVGLFGETWQQLAQTTEYLWTSMDKRWFREKVHFQSGGLAGQRMPIYDIVDGPGKGGTLRLGTFSAGAQRLAGPRYHYVIADEPFPRAIFAELWPRLLGRGGQMRIGFTPTLGTAHKLDYLWELIDDPLATFAGEIQVPFTLDAVTPRGGLVEQPFMIPDKAGGFRPMTQQDIDDFERGCPAQSRECRMGRSRVAETTLRVFEAFGSHLAQDIDLNDLAALGCKVGIGIDHGSKPGAQRAVLIAVALVHGQPRVWVLAEYKADERTSSEDDAKGIMAMIESIGLTLRDIDHWVGDRAHGGDRYGGKKSNRRLQMQFSMLSGVDPTTDRSWKRKLPRALATMDTPRKYERSVWDGVEIMHRLMVADPPGILFQKATTAALQEDLTEWRGATTDPHKDGIDACRYIVVDMTSKESRR